MALKDLVAKQSVLNEEAIEAVVRDYVRYDVDVKQLTFLPAAASLSGRQKILVYLVALQGWPIVAPGQDIATAAKPAQLEEHIGIHGGSLRPMLKDMKDRHLIARRDGVYSVRAASLSEIKAELHGNRTTNKPRQRATTPSALAMRSDNAAKKRTRPAGRGGALIEQFDSWIDEGFFENQRTLAQVRDRFHERGHIIPQSSVPTYLLGAIRARPPRLFRKKVAVNGKTVWVYYSKR